MDNHKTPASLFQQLRNPNDVAARDRFVHLYWRLLYYWAKKVTVVGEDPTDLVQDVFVELFIKLPEFDYDPAKGGFRNWLRKVCHHHWYEYRKKPANRLALANDAQIEELAVPDDNLEQFWNQDYYALLASEAFKILEEKFDETTRTVFIEVVTKGRPVNDVAKELGVSPNAVSMRKFRAMQRLRSELAEFLE